MLMPGRTYSATSSYRYGFNGKENDNEVKGEGNQQDYGMRVYDPRLGRFLSVDPLNRDFPYYSPYHFAGCNPIKFIDLDGGEPKDYIDNWISRPIGWARNGSVVGTGQNHSQITIEDPALGWISVELIYDKISEQNWFIHQGNNGKYYYYKANSGQHNVLGVQVPKNGMTIVSNGSFTEFETADAEQARIGAESADLLGMFWFGALTAPFATAAGIEVGSAIGTGFMPTVEAAAEGAEIVPELYAWIGYAGGGSAAAITYKVVQTGAQQAEVEMMLLDETLVVRGGTCTVANFENGSGVILSEGRLMNGASVNSANGLTTTELSAGIRNNQIGVTTVGQVRTGGGNVVSTPTRNNPNHATLSGITPEKAAELFTPTIPNPTKQ